LRIAWIVYGAIDQPTGGYVYDRLQIDALRASGAEVRVIAIASGDAGDALAAQIGALAPYAVVGDALCVAEVGPAFARLERDPRAGPRATRILLVHHFTSWEAEARDRGGLRRVEADAVRASDALIATSSATAARVAREHDRPVAVAPPGADRLPRPPRAPRDPSIARLLFVGSVIPRKRIPLLLDAVERALAASLALRLVGDASRDPAHAAAVGARIDGSPYLREHVARLGVLDDAELAGELARADALVLPSSLEGYGMVVTEALFAGAPVIAARGAAPDEIARGGDGGGGVVLFDGAAELDAAIARFASDAALRDRLERAASARSHDLPTWRASSSGFVEAVSAAVASTSARSA